MQELAPRKVTLIKTWVDDRGGTIKKLTPDLYGAIIDEAHRHKLSVAVHATDPRDAKALLRAGIDVFAHMISDVDDELWLSSNSTRMWRYSRRWAARAARSMRRGSTRCTRSSSRPFSRSEIKRLQSRFPQTNPEQLARSKAAWDRLASGISRLSAAGVKIGVGTDGGGQQGDQFIGWTMHRSSRTW